MLLFLKVANRQQFLPIGSRNMVVSMPNSNGHSKLTLKNVLHAPSVSYMLVSLRALDSLGYHIAISGGHLNIQSCIVTISDLAIFKFHLFLFTI